MGWHQKALKLDVTIEVAHAGSNAGLAVDGIHMEDQLNLLSQGRQLVQGRIWIHRQAQARILEACV